MPSPPARSPVPDLATLVDIFQLTEGTPIFGRHLGEVEEENQVDNEETKIPAAWLMK